MSINAQIRYDKQLVEVKLRDGRTVYQTARPRIIKTDIEDVIISVDERDRADIIANNAYGSSLDWWRIAAGNAKVNGSLHFTPGQNITIPRRR